MGLWGKAYKNLPDEELMPKLVDRDQKAFSELYDRYSRAMVNYFYKMLWQDEEKAQDFTQELFAKLIHKPELYDPSRAFKTWLYSIANNMCKNEYRKAEVRKDHVRHNGQEAMGQTGNESATAVDHQEFNKELQKALAELDEVKRETFVLRYFEELSVKEISDAMECSEGTVKSRLFYTLKKLNTQLKAFEGIYNE